MGEKKLDGLLKPLIKKATTLKPKASRSATAASCESKFGGSPYAEKEDAWPECPTCKNELTFVSQIMDESAQELSVFYYCHECFPWGLEDEEKGQWLVRLYKNPSPGKIVQIHRHTADEHAPVPCKVTESHVRVLPDWEGLDSASTEASALCSDMDDDSPWDAYEEAVGRAGCLDHPATLLGGYPWYVQGATVPQCVRCNSDMDFHAQIDSEEEADIMWGDSGMVYLFRCSQHRDEFQLELQCY